MSLRGKTILLTRRPEQAQELLLAIEGSGGQALLFPTIQVVPPESWTACDRALDQLDGFDGFVFTSPNAVGRFLGRAVSRGIDVLRITPAWAVGEKTAETLTLNGLTTETLPEEFTGEALARHIRRRAERGRLLVPHGNLASGELASDLTRAGFTVEEVEVYRTVAPSPRDAEEVRARLERGTVDAVVFFSPSAARNFAAVFAPEPLPSVLARSAVAVIGPATRNALRRLGVEPSVEARQASVRGMVEALERHFRERS